MYRKLVSAILVAVFVSGCAVGQTFDYTDSGVTVSDMGAVHSVSVAVLDQRSYIVDKTKSEAFVGLSRGGFANPFDVTTKSGDPMAVEMTKSIAKGLREKGLAVIEVKVRPSEGVSKAEEALVQTDTNRLLLFTLNEWKTDTMARTGLTYDISLDVFDSSGKKLAHSQITGDEVSGSSILSADKDAQKWFAAKVSELLSDDNVESALK